jgi:two-component system NtrC family sensor kinase
MAPLHVRSLYLKVVLPIVGLVLASMALVSFFAMRAMNEGVRLVAAQRAQFGLAYVRNTVEDVEHEMTTDHGAELQRAIERLGQNPDLDAIRILSKKGEILYSSKPAEIGQLLPSHVPRYREPVTRETAQPVFANQPGMVHVTGPVFNRRRCAVCHKDPEPIFAFVDVEISLSRQTAGIRSWSTMATIAGVAQFAAIGLGVFAILAIVVLRPVNKLVQSMDMVQHGNLDIQADATGTRELDTLVGGFNGMVARLRTARLHEQEAQRTQMVRVEQLATIGEMAASLVHEIRNPLSGIKAAVDILASEEKADEARTILGHVSAELGRVDGVIRQLLNFARPKNPVMAPTDLEELVTDVVALTRARAASQHAELSLHIPGPIVVVADAEMIHQVLVNLLINALHALEGTRDPHVDISLDVEGDWATCRVRDNGPGVPADRAETIFRPFVTTKPRGTGLGLATSRRLIDMQKGRLALTNPGQPGACFAFWLPLSDRATATEPAA